MPILPVLMMILAVTSVSQGAKYFECYQCKSTENWKCASEPRQVSTLVNCTNGLCAYVKFSGPKGSTFHRDCAETLDWSKACSSIANSVDRGEVDIVYRTCAKARCNDADRLPSSLVPTFLIVLGAFLISRHC